MYIYAVEDRYLSAVCTPQMNELNKWKEPKAPGPNHNILAKYLYSGSSCVFKLKDFLKVIKYTFIFEGEKACVTVQLLFACKAICMKSSLCGKTEVTTQRRNFKTFPLKK